MSALSPASPPSIYQAQSRARQGAQPAHLILIMNLVDSVLPSQKQMPRDKFRSALKEGGYSPGEILPRLNHLDGSQGFDGK